MNVAVEGKVYPEAPFLVEADRVRAFRTVFGERRDVVPPTFLTAAEFTVIPSIVSDPDVAIDFTRVVHGEQEYELRRPLVEGEILTIRPRIASARTKGGHGFLTIETEVRDASGEIVAVCRASMIERGGS
jgi:hypothetical protein